jgi:hypothetical protein
MALDATVYPQRFYRSEAVVIRPQILGLSATAGQVQLLLSGEIGRNYQIQTSARPHTLVPTPECGPD